MRAGDRTAGERSVQVVSPKYPDTDSAGQTGPNMSLSPIGFRNLSRRHGGHEGQILDSPWPPCVVSNIISSQIPKIRSPELRRSFRTAAQAERRRKGLFSTQTGQRVEPADRSLCPRSGRSRPFSLALLKGRYRQIAVTAAVSLTVCPSTQSRHPSALCGIDV
jgi:hypothetical protein